jgi:soluble lytic murein transglycosylase
MKRRNIFAVCAWRSSVTVFFVAPHRAMNPGVRFFYAAILALALISSKFSIHESVAAPLSGPLAPTATLSAADKDVLAARNAFDRRDLKALDALRLRMDASNHPLAAYVSYWWLSANLAQSAGFAVGQAEPIRRFLHGNADTPYAENLRKNWAKALGSMDAWDLFPVALSGAAIDDSEVVCHNWRYRLARNETNVLNEAKAAWISAKPAAENCYQVFSLLQQAQQLPNEEIWPRVRRLLESGAINDARRSASLLNPGARGFEASTAVITQNAERYLEREKPDVKSPASVELFLFAVTRVARSDARRAAVLLAGNGSMLDANDQAWAWAQVAQQGAQQQSADALTWFRRAGGAPLSDQQSAWKARAALRAADWMAVDEAIRAMSAREQREPAWRYWQARAIDAGQFTARHDSAQALRQALARENNFYGLLAAEELGIAPIPDWTVVSADAGELEQMRARPGMQRCLALYRLGLKEEALREWQFASRNLGDQQLLAAAELARENGIPDRAISAADRMQGIHDYSRRYPIPHREDLQRNARSRGLDEAWIYGLIRQESRFMADAKSAVGAMGLMQLMPATASWAAKQTGIKAFSSARTLDVPVNLSLGAYYLRHVLDNLGHPVLATAAYNAGPGRARRWQAETALEGAIYAECIPFNETRDYVKKVMANAWYYARRLDSGAPSLRELMGTVPARGDKPAINSLAASLPPAGADGSTTEPASPTSAMPSPSTSTGP